MHLVSTLSSAVVGGEDRIPPLGLHGGGGGGGGGFVEPWRVAALRLPQVALGSRAPLPLRLPRHPLLLHLRLQRQPRQRVDSVGSGDGMDEVPGGRDTAEFVVQPELPRRENQRARTTGRGRDGTSSRATLARSARTCSKHTSPYQPSTASTGVRRRETAVAPRRVARHRTLDARGAWAAIDRAREAAVESSATAGLREPVQHSSHMHKPLPEWPCGARRTQPRRTPRRRLPPPALVSWTELLRLGV